MQYKENAAIRKRITCFGVPSHTRTFDSLSYFFITEATALQQPPADKGKRLKIYYTTQVAVKPPTFVNFVNDKELMHFSYVRYLENRIREAFGFRGTALKFITRERSGKDAE